MTQIPTEDELKGTAQQPDLFAEMLAADMKRDREERAEMLREVADLVPAEDFAAAINVTEQTLTVWRSTGEGPNFAKLGRGVFYRRSDIRKWVDKNVQAPTQKEKA